MGRVKSCCAKICSLAPVVDVGGAANGNPKGQNALGRSIKIRGKLKGGGDACGRVCYGLGQLHPKVKHDQLTL
jgi:hypothetical protein